MSVIDSTSAINFKKLSTDQSLDAEFKRLRHSTSSTMNFQLLKSYDNHLIWCDVSTGHNRRYLTEKFRKTVFLNLHGLGHPSHRAQAFDKYKICMAWHEYRYRQMVPFLQRLSDRENFSPESASFRQIHRTYREI